MHVVYIGLGLSLREWFYSGSELGSFGWGVDIGLEFTVKGNKKGQLCNFENYKKKKGVQGEIYVGAWSKSPNCYCYFWSHNMSNLHCTRTNQEKVGSTNMLDLFIFGTELYFQEALDAESLFVFVPSTI